MAKVILLNLDICNTIQLSVFFLCVQLLMYNQGDKKLIICEKNIDNDYFLQFENNDLLLFLYSEYNIRCYANYKVYSVKCFVQCKVQYKD